MKSNSLEALLCTEQFSAKRVASVAASLRSGRELLPPSKPGRPNELSLLIYGHLRGHPERFEACLPLLSALVDLGQDPFQHFQAGQPSVYLEMLADDDTHPIVNWCLDLPCAPSSSEPARDKRMRSDTLEGVLLESPSPGSAKQLATLDLFGFKLLETWSDGRTTLDRLLERYYQHNVVEEKGPRKDFEFAEPQRGFTRVLNRLLMEDPKTEHIHAIRWYAWHHAYRAYDHCQGSIYRKWGNEIWQAALRQFDKTLARAMGIDALPLVKREDALWEQGVKYILSRTPEAKCAPILAGAALYQLLDSEQRLEHGKGSEAGAYHTQHQHLTSRATSEMLRALDVGSAMMHMWSETLKDDLLEWFDEDVVLKKFASALVDALPSSSVPPEVLAHPALVPCILPLIVKESLWTQQADKFYAAATEGAAWPSDYPWAHLSDACRWPESVQARLDAIALSEATPPSTRSGMRRI